MSDLVKIARERIDDTRVTHWVGCERDHRECLIQRMADEIERLRAERDEHARWRRELANKLHDREAEISDAWIELRASGVQSERCLADGVAVMRKAVQHESDCVDAAKEHIETLRAALVAAMEIVQQDRVSLYECSRNQATGEIEPEDAAAIAELDAIIAHVEAQEAENERLTAALQHEADCVEAYRAQAETMIRERDELRRQLDPMGEYASADELIAALHVEKAEDDALKRDARRYRWLRANREFCVATYPEGEWVIPAGMVFLGYSNPDADSWIDAKMGASNE